MAVLEAMASGVPVLAAKVGGVPDLIEAGRNGLFCDPLDAASMAAGVKQILENPTAARELAEKGESHRARKIPSGRDCPAAPRDLPRGLAGASLAPAN